MGQPANTPDTADTVTVENLPAVAPSVVQMTQDQLNELLRSAVAQGAAQSAATGQLVLTGQPVDAEKPAEWSDREFFQEIARRLPWHTERNERAAYAWIDRTYPAEETE